MVYSTVVYRTPLANLADGYFEDYCRLDPVFATLSGRTGFDDLLPDYSPEGWAARSALLGETLARLDRIPLGQERDAITGSVLRERLEAELAVLDSGVGCALNVVASPPMLIRICIEQADPATEYGAEALYRRLRSVPDALAGYLRQLARDLELGRAPACRQAEVVMAASRAWSGSSMFDDLAESARSAGAARSPSLRAALPGAAAAAACGYSAFADMLERDVLPSARDDDAVGHDRYRIAARYSLGTNLDIEATTEWLADRLRSLRAETEALARELVPGGDLRQVCAQLDEDRALRIDGADELRDWMQLRLDRSFDLVNGRAFTVPEPLRVIEAVVPALREASPIRYLPPAADLSRPGRVSWSVPEDRASTPVWNQLTMIHHEGVPGHHLQAGAAVLDPTLPNWQRHTTVYGHAEGWAVYAEGLMLELGALDDLPSRLGYVMGLRANVAVAMADIGVHTGRWSPDRALAFLRENSTIPESMLYFSVLRTAAWPGQALTYACGERVWRDARDTARQRLGAEFDLRRFHERMLGMGPCGLSVLADAA